MLRGTGTGTGQPVCVRPCACGVCAFRVCACAFRVCAHGSGHTPTRNGTPLVAAQHTHGTACSSAPLPGACCTHVPRQQAVHQQQVWPHRHTHTPPPSPATPRLTFQPLPVRGGGVVGAHLLEHRVVPVLHPVVVQCARVVLVLAAAQRVGPATHRRRRHGVRVCVCVCVCVCVWHVARGWNAAGGWRACGNAHCCAWCAVRASCVHRVPGCGEGSRGRGGGARIWAADNDHFRKSPLRANFCDERKKKKLPPSAGYVGFWCVVLLCPVPLLPAHTQPTTGTSA